MIYILIAVNISTIVGVMVHLARSKSPNWGLSFLALISLMVLTVLVLLANGIEVPINHFKQGV